MQRWLAIAALAIGCGDRRAPVDARPTLTRAEVNRAFLRANVGWFWDHDDGDGAPEPDEVVALALYPPAASFDDAYARIAGAATPVDARIAAVTRDLDAGRPTVVLTHAAPAERAFLDAMVAVAAQIDALYLRQNGAAALADRVAPDAASRSLFRRNRGVRCASPELENDPACTAIVGGAAQPVAAYPAALQAQPGFCATLDEALLGPFTVVQGATAVPYTEAWRDDMAAIADGLGRAADTLVDPAEQAQVSYLRAAASAFRTNDWFAADQAWAAAGASASAWYVRVGPDEVEWDPCGRKAGFHLTLARIDRGASTWKERFAPRVGEMEATFAALAGPPYAAREVAFQLPEFIHIILNAGDDREPFGGALGQSLPNWGPGTARTVVMTNLYTDADSAADLTALTEALLDGPSAARAAVADTTPSEISTVLHEIVHNLGPSAPDEDVFGGDLSYLLEELKAEIGAHHLTTTLHAAGVFSDELAAQIQASGVTWAFGTLAGGVRNADGTPKPYGQLAAIYVGSLIEAGGLVWNADAPAANGADRGAFTIDPAALDRAVADLTRTVSQIKAQGDRAAGEALVARFVDGPAAPPPAIAERARRTPPVTFVYAIAP